MANNFFNPDEMIEGNNPLASAAKKVGSHVMHQAGKQTQKTAKATKTQVGVDKAFLDALYGPSKRDGQQNPETLTEQPAQSLQHAKPQKMQQVGGLDDLHSYITPVSQDSHSAEASRDKQAKASQTPEDQKEEQQEKQEKARKHYEEYSHDLRSQFNPELLSLEQQVRKLHAQQAQKDEQEKKQEAEEKKKEEEQRAAQEREKEKEAILRPQQKGRNRMGKKADTSIAVRRAKTSIEDKSGTLG